jgi:hypothetical protein
LIAAQAQTNFVGGTGTSLDCKVGVGDLSTHNSDEIALTFGERALGLKRPAARDTRNAMGDERSAADRGARLRRGAGARREESARQAVV